MSLSFEIALAPPRGLRALVALIAAASGAGALLAAARLAEASPAAAGALALAWALLVLGGWRRWRSGLALARRLRVDEHGQAWLVEAGRVQACSPRRWLLGERFVALRLELEPPDCAASAPRPLRSAPRPLRSAPRPLRSARRRHLDLLAGPGPGPGDADAWRRLRAWLAWLERGGPPSAQAPAGAAGASRQAAGTKGANPD